MAFFHSPLPSRSEWTTMAAIAVSLFEFLVHCDINWKFEKEYSFFFLFWNWTSIDQPRSYERRWSTHFNFDPSREYSVKNQSFRRIDTTSSNMANTKEKAWRERERESGCFANRYSCSQLLQILQPQVCGYRISNRARISSSTGCKHQPELFVNFSPPIRYPIRTRETDRYVSPRAGWKKTFSSGKIDKLAGHILEWHLISQFDRPVGDVCTVCSFLGRIRAFCRPVKGLTLRKYVDVNVWERVLVLESRSGPWRPIEFNPEKDVTFRATTYARISNTVSTFHTWWHFIGKKLLFSSLVITPVLRNRIHEPFSSCRFSYETIGRNSFQSLLPARLRYSWNRWWKKRKHSRGNVYVGEIWNAKSKMEGKFGG